MNTVLISGASSGIGESLCKLYLENGYKVFGVSRHKGSVPEVNYFEADVTDFGAVKAAVDEIGKSGIDILINNAGMGIAGSIEKNFLGDGDERQTGFDLLILAFGKT